MSIYSDVFEERVEKLEIEKEHLTKYYENKINNLEKMLLNVCQNVYKLNANLINEKQLLAIVNGCLDPKVIDRFTWDYLTDSDVKDEEINKKIKDKLDSYLNEAKSDMILADSIDLDSL